MPAPTAPRHPHVHREHGLERPDPWHWTKDRAHPDLLPLLKAENAWVEACLPDEAARSTLYQEMLARIQEDDAAVPVRLGPWWWTTRTEKGRPYAVHVRRETADGADQVVLDENQLAAGHDYFKLEQMAIAPDHQRVAWLQDLDGGERFTLHVRDLPHGEPRQVAEGLKWTLAWYSDARHVLVTRADHAQRPYQAWRIDTWGEASPTLLFEEPDERFFVSVERSRDGRELLIEVASKITSEVHSVDAADPTALPQVVWPRRAGVLYDVEPCGDVWFIRTNDVGIEFRVVAVPARDPAAALTILHEHDPQVYVTGLQAFRRHLVLWERVDGLPTIRVRALVDGAERRLSFPEASYHLAPERNPEFDTAHLRVLYTSPRTPDTVLQVDLNADVRTVLKTQPVTGHDPERYVVERLDARAADGELVPITLLRRREQAPAGGPVYLIGYGSYGYAFPASFRSSRFSLVDRGVPVAIAHIRGGTERGRRWYEDGKLAAKKNTFSDFIAAAEHLVATGWTRPGALAIQGGSAGGLLMGAVLNLRPELFRACVAHVPFVDVASTMSDASLPLTVTEYDEWGDPNQEDVFRRLLTYSPYDNVHAAPYPAVLATAGLNDPRVGYWEPTKWVQALRAYTTSDHPVLFRVHLGAGHGGQSGRYGQLDDLAWEYHFVLSQLHVSIL